MFAALRTATARLLGSRRPVPGAGDEAYADVTHLLEAVTAPLPVYVGTVPTPGFLLEDTVEIEWGAGLEDDDLATEEVSEREAGQVLRQAGVLLDEGSLSDRIERGLLAVCP